MEVAPVSSSGGQRAHRLMRTGRHEVKSFIPERRVAGGSCIRKSNSRELHNEQLSNMMDESETSRRPGLDDDQHSSVF